VVFGQDVGQVMVVVVGVAGPGQGKHLFPDLKRDASGRRATPVAMDQAGGAVPAATYQPGTTMQTEAVVT
jgi:hypothetical protein